MISWFENERKISNNTFLRADLRKRLNICPRKQEMPVICFNYLRGWRTYKHQIQGGAKDFKIIERCGLIFTTFLPSRRKKECFIVEGEIDCLTLIECGIYNVVSVAKQRK